VSGTASSKAATTTAELAAITRPYYLQDMRDIATPDTYYSVRGWEGFASDVCPPSAFLPVEGEKMNKLGE